MLDKAYLKILLLILCEVLMYLLSLSILAEDRDLAPSFEIDIMLYAGCCAK